MLMRNSQEVGSWNEALTLYLESRQTNKTIDEKTKKLLGGSIDTKKVTFKDVEPTAPVAQGETAQERFHQVLQRIAKDETATTIQLSSMRDDLNDYRMRNIVPY